MVRVHIQNVARQNVELQNVEYQNVDNNKTSTLQNVESQNVDSAKMHHKLQYNSILFHCVKCAIFHTYTVTFTVFHLVLRNWSRKELHHLRRSGLGKG
jgi:hypothetical protein